jgi:hypothetical protein
VLLSIAGIISQSALWALVLIPSLAKCLDKLGLTRGPGFNPLPPKKVKKKKKLKERKWGVVPQNSVQAWLYKCSIHSSTARELMCGDQFWITDTLIQSQAPLPGILAIQLQPLH